MSEGNILAAAIEASRARATVREISDALRRVFGDHTVTATVVSGAHAEAYSEETEYRVPTSRLADVSARLGSKPRILVAKLGAGWT